MDKFNRLYRIYRFYILSILFCIFIPNLVYFKKDIYKILYSLPSFEMLFYPVYSVMVTYFDVMFITDYLYYYNNPYNEISLRVRNTQVHIIKKIIICTLLMVIKMIIINIFIFNKDYIMTVLICVLEEIVFYYINMKIIKKLSLDKKLIFILISLLIIRQYINIFLI